MQKIALCGYYGMCDSQNNIIGHVGKVTKEYFDLLVGKYEVSLMASPCIFDEISKERNISGGRLRYDIVIDVPFTIGKRILDKYKIMKNIRDCIHNSEIKTLFFYQTDFFFFLYIFLFYRKNDKKIFGLIYHQNFTGGKFEKCLRYVYKKALKKLDGIIYTQKKACVDHPKTMHMPDYIYDERVYSKYDKSEKLNKVVCLGTMNRYKQLEELIEVFRETNMPLEICGRFDDKTRVQELIKKKGENVTISDCILSTEEYYRKLGMAKYSILPYDMQQYISRTSGVLLESIYVGSIPIAPKILLEQNEIVGYGYDRLEDLKTFNWNCSLQVNKMNEIVKENSQKMIEHKLQKFFE